jgi:periplasmic divalent cation tolerance protein
MTGLEARVALVTAPSEAVGADLCRTLVEERLAACGNVVPGGRAG